MIARWLALALLLVLPLRAIAETCTFSTSGSWTSATAYSGTDDCTLDASDSIIIPNGVVVTVPAAGADVDVPMTTGTITVESGGTLIVQGAGGLGIPDAGLRVRPGGTFRPRGSAISYGDTTPTLVSALSDGGGADVNTVLPVGRIIHCPGTPVGTLAATTSAIVEDCNGDELGTHGSRSQVAICYPNANVSAQRIGGFQVAGAGWPGEGFYPELLANMSVGDVVVFWDSTNAHPSHDVNAMYEVQALNVAAVNQCMILSVQQGGTEVSCASTAKNCALADRDIREVTLQSAYVAGQRNVSVDTAAVTSTGHHAARHLTCPPDYDGDGTAELGSTQTVAIVGTKTGATDTLRLMPGGFSAGVPNGATCWIDYGWQAGDSISVFRPARLENIQNSTCTASGTPVACCTSNGTGQCGTVTCARGATCDFDFALITRTGQSSWFGPLTTVDNTWIREAGYGMHARLLEGPGPVNRLQVTSPASYNTINGRGDGHGFSPNGGGTTVFTDSVFRHWGDDLFVSQICTVSGDDDCTGTYDPDTSKVYGVTLRRVRAEYAGCAGLTCQVFDESALGGGATVYQATDLLLRDAQDRAASTSAIYLSNSATPGRVDLRNSTWIANGQTVLTHEATVDSRLEFRNLYDIGRLLTGMTTPLWRAHLISDASLIEEENTGSGGYILSTNGLRATSPMAWNRLLLLDADSPASAAPTDFIYTDTLQHSLTVNDIAIISPNRTGNAAAGTAWRVYASAADTDSLTIRRPTLAMRPGESGQLAVGIYGFGDDGTFNGGYRTLTKGIGAYFWNTGVTATSFYADTADLEFLVPPLCLVGNDSDTNLNSGNTGGVYDSRSVFVDPRVGNFEPVPTSALYRAGCGARKVGAKDMWALRVLGHDIYAGNGDTWKRPTGGGGKRGPRATP